MNDLEFTSVKSNRLPGPYWAERIATFFGAGYARRAPGTVGSFFALLVIVLFSVAFVYDKRPASCAVEMRFPEAASVACLIDYPRGFIPVLPAAFLFALSTILGILASNVIVKATKIKDPSAVVIDEVAGQSLAFGGTAFCLYQNISSLLISSVVAFGLFRLFDIWKPWPIRRLEKLPGGWGIMADDLAAGAISALILAALLLLGWLPNE